MGRGTQQFAPLSLLAQRFPFLSLSASIVVLRVAVAGFFMAHAIVRIFNGSIPRFGDFLEREGWPNGVALVWAISSYEIIGGVLMAAGAGVRWAAAGLAFIAAMGIVIIHARAGWFVGEHGTGGSEYSVALLVSLLVVAAADCQDKNAKALRRSEI